MTSLRSLLPLPGSSNWRGTVGGANESATVVRHAVVREVWLQKTPTPHAVYKVDVMSNAMHWFVLRRFKEFYRLHQKLCKRYRLPRDLLPPRILVNNMEPSLLEARREALEHFLQKLINSSSRDIATSKELFDFLDVAGHSVTNVVMELASYLMEYGDAILSSEGSFSLSPHQMYAINKQRELPLPDRGMDLANLYSFVHDLTSLYINDVLSQWSHGKQFESELCYCISSFSSLTTLHLNGCQIHCIQGISSLQPKLESLSVSYCLTSMKEVLVDCAASKRQVSTTSHEGWRSQATYKLTDKRIVVQPWMSLTNVDFSHNKITVVDFSIKLMPLLDTLNLSHNLLTHFDMQVLSGCSLRRLVLSSNKVYSISSADEEIPLLEDLDLAMNRLHSLDGLECAVSLRALEVGKNSLAMISEIKKLTVLEHLACLGIAGNPVAERRRHRLSVLLYFKDQPLVLDKTPWSRGEKVKVARLAMVTSYLASVNEDNFSITTSDDDSGFAAMAAPRDSGECGMSCSTRAACGATNITDSASTEDMAGPCLCRDTAVGNEHCHGDQADSCRLDEADHHSLLGEADSSTDAPVVVHATEEIQCEDDPANFEVAEECIESMPD